MTRMNYYYFSFSLDEISKWANTFLDNGLLDIKHGFVMHCAVYSVDVEDAVNIIVP